MFEAKVPARKFKHYVMCESGGVCCGGDEEGIGRKEECGQCSCGGVAREQGLRDNAESSLRVGGAQIQEIEI